MKKENFILHNATYYKKCTHVCAKMMPKASPHLDNKDQRRQAMIFNDINFFTDACKGGAQVDRNSASVHTRISSIM